MKKVRFFCFNMNKKYIYNFFILEGDSIDTKKERPYERSLIN